MLVCLFTEPSGYFEKKRQIWYSNCLTIKTIAGLKANFFLNYLTRQGGGITYPDICCAVLIPCLCRFECSCFLFKFFFFFLSV